MRITGAAVRLAPSPAPMAGYSAVITGEIQTSPGARPRAFSTARMGLGRISRMRSGGTRRLSVSLVRKNTGASGPEGRKANSRNRGPPRASCFARKSCMASGENGACEKSRRDLRHWSRRSVRAWAVAMFWMRTVRSRAVSMKLLEILYVAYPVTARIRTMEGITVTRSLVRRLSCAKV